MSWDNSYMLNRTMCDVLEEMRQCWETRNFAYIKDLIEEAQSMANRMESGLSDQHDLQEMHEEWTKLRAEIKALRKERDELKKETGHADAGNPDDED